MQAVLSQFENLFKNLGDVQNGFPASIELKELENREEYNPAMLQENLMFGTPDEVITKLSRYEALGVDQFTYYASMGLGRREQKRSLEPVKQDPLLRCCRSSWSPRGSTSLSGLATAGR